MLRSATVIVPLDGSVVAEGIVPFLREIASPLDLELVLLNVLEAAPAEVSDAARPAVTQEIAREDRSAIRDLAPLERDLKSAGIRVHLELRRGDAADQIVAAAREHGAALIAMSAHGRSGLKRELYGAVAEDVLRQASVPVLLFRVPDEHVARFAAETSPLKRAS